MDLHPVWDWFRWLHETTGIKLTIFYDAFDRARFCERLPDLGPADGDLPRRERRRSASSARGCRARGCASLRLVMQGYIQFFRNTPPLVQLYFFYFALGSLPEASHRHRHRGAARLELRLGGDLPVVLRRRVQRRDLPLRHRGGAARDVEAAESARLQRGCKAYVYRDPAARVPHQPAGAQQQSRQPGEDHDASPMRSPCRRCSTWRTRSGRTSSTCRR